MWARAAEVTAEDAAEDAAEDPTEDAAEDAAEGPTQDAAEDAAEDAADRELGQNASVSDHAWVVAGIGLCDGWQPEPCSQLA